MRIMYCDRCGVEHRDGVKGGRVVRVTWQPLPRTMDLCGRCRTELQKALDTFEQGSPQATASVERAPNPQPPAPASHAGEGSFVGSALSGDIPARADGEAWDAYAHRLERRIKAQRDHIDSLHALHVGEANRADRKKIERLKRALATVTESWQREREARIALVAERTRG